MKKTVIIMTILSGLAFIGIFYQYKAIHIVESDISLPLGSPGLQCKLVRVDQKKGIFHQPGCRFFNCKTCTRAFPSRHEAIKAGFAACEICRP